MGGSYRNNRLRPELNRRGFPFATNAGIVPAQEPTCRPNPHGSATPRPGTTPPGLLYGHSGIGLGAGTAVEARPPGPSGLPCGRLQSRRDADRHACPRRLRCYCQARRARRGCKGPPNSGIPGQPPRRSSSRSRSRPRCVSRPLSPPLPRPDPQPKSMPRSLARSLILRNMKIILAC